MTSPSKPQCDLRPDVGDGRWWTMVEICDLCPDDPRTLRHSATTGVPGREDIGIGFSYNDHQAGLLHGTVAVLAALQARRTTGRGQRVDISQFEVGINFIGPSLLDLAANGTKARAVGNDHPMTRWHLMASIAARIYRRTPAQMTKRQPRLASAGSPLPA